LSISYTLNTPVSSNDPSVDQPNLTENTNAVSSIWAIDHNTFNTSSSAPSGTHLQTTFYANQTPTLGSALAITYPGSRPSVYTNGTGGTETNLYTVNPLGIFPASIIKAGATFTASESTSAITPTSQFNVNGTISNTGGSGTKTYVINLIAGTCTGNNVIVLTNTTGTTFTPGWSFASNVLTLTSASNSGQISFVILQV